MDIRHKRSFLLKRSWKITDDQRFFSHASFRSFFWLDDAEYDEAIKTYPELAKEEDIDYVKGTATGSIAVGGNCYFDNASILEQFTRLLNMLEFKKEFKQHQIEVIVDNARTHTAKAYSLTDFGKSIGTRCPVRVLEYTDARGVQKCLGTHFTTGLYKGRSKGLLEIARELDVDVSTTI